MHVARAPATAADSDYRRAVTLYKEGRAAECERVLCRVLAANGENAAALHLLGALLLQRGQHGDAVPLLVKALGGSLPPAHAASVRSALGAALKAQGRLEEAIHQLRAAVRLDPNSIEAQYNLGNALLAANVLDEAIACYRAVMARAPDFIDAYNNLGNALLASGRPGEALPHFELMAARQPDFAAAQLNVGDALLALGRRDEAARKFEKAVALQPDSVEAHLRLREIRTEEGRFGDATRHYQRAVASNPDAVVAHFTRAAARTPASAAAQFALGEVLGDQAHLEEAEACYARTLALDPHFGQARLALCTTCLPVVYDDEDAILAARVRYEQRLAELEYDMDDPAVLRAIGDTAGTSLPFYLPYQGFNDCDLQRRYGALLCRAVAGRYPPARLPPRPSAGEKIRVGIVSAFFSRHSNWKIPIRGWLNQLDRSRFSIFGYYTLGGRDDATAVATTLCDRFVQGPLPVATWRETILADAPHVLIYPEIGMEATAAALAAQRLAPVQCNSWGHPNTSGFPTLDYFLSSDLMEPPDAQNHYTERVVRLPNLSIYYEPIEAKPAPLERAAFGLRPQAKLFWCGQSLFKYLPRYDAVFARIAAAVGDCQFVFVHQPGHPTRTARFRRRLERAFAAVGRSAADYCVFLPYLNRDRFLAAIGLCDVNLDSIGWSGCNSTLESFLLDLPLVTLKGELMRGRHGAAILEMIGVTETITASLDDYVAQALRLAQDAAWNAAIRRRISANKHRAYRDRAPIIALEEFLDRVVHEPR